MGAEFALTKAPTTLQKIVAEFALTRDNTLLDLTGELWGVCCGDFGEQPRYKSTTRYLQIPCQSLTWLIITNFPMTCTVRHHYNPVKIKEPWPAALTLTDRQYTKPGLRGKTDELTVTTKAIAWFTPKRHHVHVMECVPIFVTEAMHWFTGGWAGQAYKNGMHFNHDILSHNGDRISINLAKMTLFQGNKTYSYFV